MANKESDLSGKNALITGCAKRLGRETGLSLARAGVNLAVHFNRSEGPAEEVAREARELGVRAYPIQADLGDADAAEPLFAQAWEELDGIDLLVNNASIFPTGRLDGMTLAELHRNLGVNAWVPFVLARAFWRKIRSTELKGSVVNMLDTRLVGGDLAHAPYHLSKALLGELTTLTALEFAPELRVNGVAPGAVLPPEELDEAYLEELTRELPLQREGISKGHRRRRRIPPGCSIRDRAGHFRGRRSPHPHGRKHVSDKILIQDLLIRGLIGIHDWEREKKQDILINVEMEADCSRSRRERRLPRRRGLPGRHQGNHRSR